MAADQRRKRLNSVSGGGCSSLEQYKMKKRKLEPPQNGLNSKSHISLEWDENRKRVVAKKEQIGISRRNLKPFVGSSLGSRNALADVFSIPQEAFELESLTEVLSYEVWQNQLSEEERNYLMQYLPSGQNAEQVVEALLAGDNFHFGNPFLKWGDSLCSGNFHPDAVLHKERCLKADKKAYYLELRKYHNDIIEYLQKLKERWENCRDPEKEILPKICRSRMDVEKRISSNAYEFGLRDLEQDVTGTSESCSWVADEKGCSSDNQNYSVMKGGELQKRKYEKGFTKDKTGNSLIASEDVLNVGAKSKKGEKLNKRNIHHDDGAQYMSYLKISRKQLELVKSMKQSSKSIQSRSLNRVLGNLDCLHIRPYEVFVEEEQKKLHEHWFQLANDDLPAFYGKWKERKLQMWQVKQSLGQEMKEKLKCLIEDEEMENRGFQDEEMEDRGFQDEEMEDPSFQDEEMEDPGFQDEKKENNESAPQDPNDDGATDNESNIKDEDSAPSSTWDQPLQQITSPSGSHQSNPVDGDPENNFSASKSDNLSSDGCGHSGKMNAADETVSQEAGGVVWPAISRSHSYYDSSARHEFAASGLPLMSPQVNEDHQTHLIDLESDLRAEDMGKDLLPRQSDDSSLSSYQNQDQNDLLHRRSDDGPMNSYQNQDRNDFLQRQSDVGCLSSYQNQDRNDFLHRQSDVGPLSSYQNQERNDLLHRQSDVGPLSSYQNQERNDLLHRQSDEFPLSSYQNQDRNDLLQRQSDALPLSSYQNQDRNDLLHRQSDDGPLSSYQNQDRNDLLHRQSDNGAISSYQNQDRNELLQSLFKGREMLGYHQEQKQTGLDFQSPSNSMMGDDGQFPGNFHEQLTTSLPLEQGQKRHNEIFMQQNISENIFSDRGRFLIPRQENLQVGNMHNWTINPVRISEPLESHLNGGELLSQNWLSGEHQVRGGWTNSGGVSIQSQSIGNGSNADQSLFSVLPNCGQLRSVNPYDSIGSTEQFISSRNYGLMAGVAPGINNSLPNTAHPLDYLGGRDSVMADDMGWVSLPHQNPGLHDPMGKPYLRSWNQ